MQTDKALLHVEPFPRGRDDQLESWKEVAAHLRRSVRTVKRWEKVEGLPVHRHAHNKSSTQKVSRHSARHCGWPCDGECLALLWPASWSSSLTSSST
jgi:hypothetical protein